MPQMKKERSNINTVQMDNHKGFSGIRRIDVIPNASVGELCDVKKGMNERIDESVFRGFWVF